MGVCHETEVEEIYEYIFVVRRLTGVMSHQVGRMGSKDKEGWGGGEDF